MQYDKALDKKEYADLYFNALHNKGQLVTPPYTYSYILAHDSIRAVEKNGKAGFVMFPYKHFILPTYTEKDGFDNSDCIFAQPYSLGKTRNKHMGTQFLLHRENTLLNHVKLGEVLEGNGRPVLFNKKELNWYLNHRRVVKHDECVYKKDAGQHFFLFEYEDLKLLIIWDDYYSSCINIIAVTHIVEKHIQHVRFNRPYSITQVYMSAFCSFVRMFPCGTLFNVTVEELRGVVSKSNSIYLSLKPIACFDLCTTIKDDIKEKVRFYNKYSRNNWRNNEKHKASKDRFNIEKDVKKHPKPKHKRKKTKRHVKKRVHITRRTRNMRLVERRYATGKIKRRHMRRKPGLEKKPKNSS